MSFVKNAQSKNAMMAIVYITLPNSAAWQADAEKKTQMFFGIVIEYAAASKELTAASNEKPALANFEFEADRQFSRRFISRLPAGIFHGPRPAQKCEK